MMEVQRPPSYFEVIGFFDIVETQYLPGMAILRASGYDTAAKPIMVGTSLASLAVAFKARDPRFHDAAMAVFAAPQLAPFEVVSLPGGPPAIATWRDWYSVAEPLAQMIEREPAAAAILPHGSRAPSSTATATCAYNTLPGFNSTPTRAPIRTT